MFVTFWRTPFCGKRPVCVRAGSNKTAQTKPSLFMERAARWGASARKGPEGNLIDLAMVDMETSSSLRKQSLLSPLLSHTHSSSAYTRLLDNVLPL